ncbi:MAG: hypothetical protein IJS47_00955 [Clostridia bacterium]|nr:hypothetical protein [Clostridia bacterium]
MSDRIGISILIPIIIIALLTFAIFYLGQPAWTLSSPGLWTAVFLVGVVTTLFLGIYDYLRNDESGMFIVCLLITLGILVLFGILGLVSAPIFNGETYKNAIKIEERNFEEDFSDVQDEQFFDNLDLDTAIRLGNRVVGSIQNAAWYEVDREYNLIKYQDELYRLSPLNYGGLFKFNKAKYQGIPGYILVNVHTCEANFVENTIRYSPSGYFSMNLKRHLRGQYPSYVFDTSFLEIDEEGTPFWVTGVKRRNAGLFGARTVESFILTNAETGESTEYKIEDKPDWIDHVFSLSYLMEVAYWHYEYANGVVNPSKTGVYRTSYTYRVRATDEHPDVNFYGYNSFVDNDGTICVFTGITPANGAEANTGFLTVNTATGEFKYYPVAGAEESSAQDVAEGLVQNLGYEATYPIVTNVGGEPTYLMSLKDKSGLIQRTAMVNLKNYAIAVVGNEFHDTTKAYLAKLSGEGSESVNNSSDVLSITGTIEKIYQAEIEGTTYRYYLIDGELYKAAITINEKQLLLTEGDTVEITYRPGDINDIVNFK